MYHTSDFSFDLPHELIAVHPLEKRDASRMLVVNPNVYVKKTFVEVIPEKTADVIDTDENKNVSCSEVQKAPESKDNTDEQSYENKEITENKNIPCSDLPKNMELKECAEELRKTPKRSLDWLWEELQRKKIKGIGLFRNYIVGDCIVDLFCPQKRFVIEIDERVGKRRKNKQAKEIAEKDAYLQTLNVHILHVSESGVLRNPSLVAQQIYGELLGTRFVKQTPDENVSATNTCTDTETNVVNNESDENTNQNEKPNNLELQDKHIHDFLDYLQPGDVVVFNNSRVIPARFMADKYEMTLHTAVNEKDWWALCKKFNKIRTGDVLTMVDGTQVRVLKRNENGVLLHFYCDNVFDVLEQVGKLPLPPYIKREEELDDRNRYQTVYAGPLGSLAAPTAGLHFTDELMSEIEKRGAKIVKITLHVGAGTWMTVKTENLAEHKMHREWCCITADQAEVINRAKRVIAVGTTSVRTLETAHRVVLKNFAENQKRNRGHGRGKGKNNNNNKMPRVTPICRTTNIFITPGYKFGAVDMLLTNFHLPKSTLFMLVSAFCGLPEMKTAYAHAIEEKYRFFSYGDCCLLFKKETKRTLNRIRKEQEISATEESDILDTDISESDFSDSDMLTPENMDYENDTAVIE